MVTNYQMYFLMIKKKIFNVKSDPNKLELITGPEFSLKDVDSK